MTTVLVTGASGVLGTSLLDRPAASGLSIRATSRRATDGAASGGVEWRRADLVTGEGLEQAVAGVDVVVHAASAPRGDTEGTDVEGTRRLLAAARAAGVGHVVFVSIVGVDRVPLAYYVHKLAAERVVEGGGVPWTILRGTQFHDFVDGLCAGMARLPVAVVPARVLGQPVDVGEFADALWTCVASGPAGRAPDVAGPEVLTYEAMMRAWLGAQGRHAAVLRVPVPGRAAAALRRGYGTAPSRAVGRLTWGAWLAARYAPGGPAS